MKILREPLERVTADDLAQLCEDQVPEGIEVEYKADLPGRDGRKDPWHTGGAFSDYARNQIAEEIVAFANTTGGVVCVGVAETADEPKRAKEVQKLPNVHDLARRLRQAIYAIIDPPLPVFESSGVVTDENGGGVVILRVSASRRRPHRHQASKEVFVRRADESVRLGMREIQELTIRALTESRGVEETIEDRRKKSRTGTYDWLKKLSDAGQPFWGAGVHFLAVPATNIDLGRVVGRSQLNNLNSTTTVHFSKEQTHPCYSLLPRFLTWRPSLRSIAATSSSDNRRASFSLDTGGACEMTFDFRAHDEAPGLYAEWLAAAMGMMLTWAERVRNEAGNPVEYVLASQISVFGSPVLLCEYGLRNYFESNGYKLPVGFHVFPLASVGTSDEFPALLKRFDEDLWNLAGEDFHQTEINFSIDP